MNKQQLANRIWKSANRMRSKIDANEYKDYILGLIFYRFLCEKELDVLHGMGVPEEEIESLDEGKRVLVEYLQNDIGYFIAYDNLYSTWLSKRLDFSVSNVIDALNAFDRLISPDHRHVYKGVFDTLSAGISKLGDTAQRQTKAIADLLDLIRDIPMGDQADYDVLGFIYEYLIGQFASNAGKKAGEFYTPHEVSVLMADIIAGELAGQGRIDIYDPTSGSGSLLINIGKAVERRTAGPDGKGVPVRYFAQELKSSTYNLTRMNLVMRGIEPGNIVTRNADTLAEDWPYFDDERAYEPLYVNACVSNPPYSQHWDPKGAESDPRFTDYGVAPASKADYAFLLHNLYHLKPEGVMTIVLPHGVLFRGGEEGAIRERLVERCQIDAVIGLPPNIFYGTGIPTIVMVLKKVRERDDILFIDASKGFVKDGTKNRLRSSDIRRITDAYDARRDVTGFCRVVPKTEIVANGYNLNIPRYVDASEKARSVDLYATVFGGVPDSALDALSGYWNELPGMREALFERSQDGPVSLPKVTDISAALRGHPSAKAFASRFASVFEGFGGFVEQRTVGDVMGCPYKTEEDVLAAELRNRCAAAPLCDYYGMYQVLDDAWSVISADLEVLQTDGMDAVRQVDANMVEKSGSKSGEYEEVQDKKEPWVGRVLPFPIVQRLFLADELEETRKLSTRLDEIRDGLSEALDALPQEERDSDVLNESNDAFDRKGLARKVDEILSEDEGSEYAQLSGYIALFGAKASAKAKRGYIAEHPAVDWSAMEANKQGVYAKGAAQARLDALAARAQSDDEAVQALFDANRLLAEQSAVKKQLKEAEAALIDRTCDVIAGISDEDALKVLRAKWLVPIEDGIAAAPAAVLDGLEKELRTLADEYGTSLSSLDADIADSEAALLDGLSGLTGSDADMEAVAEVRALLGGGAR